MRLLQLNSARGWGGGETLVWQLCVGLEERGHSVAAITRRGSPLAQKLEACRITVHPCAPKVGYDLARAMVVAALVRRTGTDILHAHSGRDYVPAMVAGALGGCRVVLHRHVPLPISPSTRWMATRWAAAICAASDFVRDGLVARDGVPAEMVHTMPLLPDLRLFGTVADAEVARVRAEVGAVGVPLIVSVGHLYHSKGHGELIRAFALLRARGTAAVLAIAGEGEDRPHFEGLIRELGLGDCVRLLGLRADVPALLQAADAFALLSWEEAMGSAIIEAMFMSRPVVATRAGGIPGFVTDGQTGLLVPPHAPEEAATALAALLRDRELAGRLADAGHAYATANLTLAAALDRLEGLYCRVAGRAQAGKLRAP